MSSDPEDLGTGVPRAAATCTVDASGPLEDLDLRAAREWYFLVTAGGTPCAYLRLPSPGPVMSAELTEAVLARQADAALARQRFVESFRRRMGPGPPPPAGRPTCSVVVCTRRRPRHLSAALEAVARLDPAADELIVVDNDPGADDARAEAEAAGARYVREDRRGLNNARATGLAAAAGDLVAYTDDDCVPAPGWLRSLPELFGDATVGAVTGPAFAYSVETAAQRAREKHASFIQGLGRSAYDWTTIQPVNSGGVGAGANMIFRRDLLRELGDVFPPELDVGTPTRSGGDLYVLYRLLAAGHRVAYDPATYVFHRHAPDAAALHETILGYGIGFSAFLTKVLVEEREVAALRAWWWLWRGYRGAFVQGLIGGAEPGQVRLRWNYLRGGLLGPLAWRRARTEARRAAGRPPGGVTQESPAAVAPAGRRERLGVAPLEEEAAGRGPLTVSVIVLAAEGSPSPCLEGLRRQRLTGAAMEVIVVWPEGPAPERAGAGSDGHGGPLRHVHGEARGGGLNAGARAANGGLLLFLDGRLAPEEKLVARHLDRHRGVAGARIVLGGTRVRPLRQNFATLHELLRRGDRLHAREEAAALTFVDVQLINASMTAETLRRVGELDGRLESARADWEWGIRALLAGAELVHAREAGAFCPLSEDAAATVEASRIEGRDDAVIAARHPFAAASLPGWPSRRAKAARPARSLATLLFRRRRPRQLGLWLLDLLEWSRDRGSWVRLFEVVSRGAYEAGFLERGDPPRGAAWRGPVQAVELGSPDPIAPPAAAAPRLELRLEGRPVARLRPERGRWNGRLAERAYDALPPRLRDDLRKGHRRSAGSSGGPGALCGLAVVLGPARERADDRHRQSLEAQGARVEVLDGDRQRHWHRLDAAIRASREELMVLPLPGVAIGPACLAAIRPALDGERVACVVGAGLRPGEPPSALGVWSRRVIAGYRSLGWPAQYLAVRPRAYEVLGGFDFDTARFGPPAPLLDLVDRAVQADLVVAYGETTGIEPPGCYRPTRSRNAWRTWRARGGLLARRSFEAAEAGEGRRLAYQLAGQRLTLLWRSLTTGRPSRRHWMGSTVALVVGWLAAAQQRRAARNGGV